MSIFVSCECGRESRAKDSFAGRSVRCPACGATINIPPKDPESMFQRGSELFKKERYREAAVVLEETATVAPRSAPVHFFLGSAYTQVEHGGSEEAIRPWAKKAIATFKKAIELHERFGGLNSEQLQLARDFVLHTERVFETQEPSLPEDQRRKIYADFVETRESEFLLGTSWTAPLSCVVTTEVVL